MPNLTRASTFQLCSSAAGVSTSVIAVLAVSILGCGGVLTYSFTNYAKLKRNAEEVRNYIAPRAKTADRHRGDNQMAVGDIRVSSVDNRSVSVKTVIPLAAGTGRQVVNAGIPTSKRDPRKRWCQRHIRHSSQAGNIRHGSSRPALPVHEHWSKRWHRQ
ncbi:hypothetical protein HPB51_023146 [Rhipicephalus microplus]|uniref:Uncharacterized protein n=1 Tax=Rhipicephalus microplus TaxID=6941 RepID=A0A9J6DX90_RHIMP|nr:hypothetical protein HPB51_023146 [Rhipicephalus microplus]